MNMKSKRVSSFVIAGSLATAGLTGCGAQKNELLSYRVEAPAIADTSVFAGTQGYLSEELCVIPKKKQTTEQDAVMKAKASLLINDTSGTMLYSHNIYKKIYPASITKIVTALVALQYGNMEDTVTVSYNASHITEYGAKLCGFQEGDKIVLKDLLYSFLICSGNDAGIAIAEHIAGDVASFSELMNQEMQKLGAVHSHFVNPHGLHDKNHYTTAYDLYLVFHELAKNDFFMEIVKQPEYTAKFRNKKNKKKKLYFLSTDRYLIGRAAAPEGITVLGGKTGTTSDAGSCLILYSKDKKENHFVSVVLKAEGGDDLYIQMNRLLEMACR